MSLLAELPLNLAAPLSVSTLGALERPVMAFVRILGLTLLSGCVATVLGLLYRSYAREEMPEGLAVLVGLGVVGGWLNTTTALRQFLGSGEVLPSPETAMVNVAAFVLGAGAALVGARSGARLLGGAFALAGADDLDADVGRLVQSVGRFVTVELPEEIDDVDGYEPLDSDEKAELSGRSFRFPRGLTVAELRERLVARLRDDHGVGHVDVELADDGTVQFLAAGGRAVGIGPTLAPGTVAVALRADPAFSASPGDVVQIWSVGDDPERVATAELRATVGDVATVALDADDATRLVADDTARFVADDTTRLDAAARPDSDAEYRLVTLPAEPRADREFSARLRGADETVGAVTLAADSPLVGAPMGSVDATVVALRNADGVETIPPDDRPLAARDTLYVVARPDLIRKVETAASNGNDSTGTAAE